jgi:hypothetical protein
LNRFNGTFDAGNIHRLLVAGNSSAINSVIFQNFPLYDQVLILINTPHYGGSGGSRAVSSLHTSAPEIMLHEMGHSFGGLADEYYAGDQYANERPNMTQETNPVQVKWKNWMDDQGIGIYQHCCGGNSAEWYRPHEGCKMRALGTNYPFCAVCKETMIERIHFLFGSPVVSRVPAQNSVSMCGAPIGFTLNTAKPNPNTISTTWISGRKAVAVQRRRHALNDRVRDIRPFTDGARLDEFIQAQIDGAQHDHMSGRRPRIAAVKCRQ